MQAAPDMAEQAFADPPMARAMPVMLDQEAEEHEQGTDTG